MSKALMRAAINSLFPDGVLWRPEPGKEFDELLDAFAGSSNVIRSFLNNLADVRNPFKTPLLEDLEREYGILTDLRLTEETRRLQLASIIYASEGTGADDDLQQVLNDAGFDVFVYQNSPDGPAVDPAIFLDQAFIMVAGGGNAYAGRADAFAGRIGGELLVNGEFFTTLPDYEVVAGNLYAGAGGVAGFFNDVITTKKEYLIPVDPDVWPGVFFVGGPATFDGGTGEILTIETADIPNEREQLFKRLILRKKGLYTWGALVVTYV